MGLTTTQIAIATESVPVMVSIAPQKYFLQQIGKGLVDVHVMVPPSAFYGLVPNDHQKPHPHFCCTHCGQMDCLIPESLNFDTNRL